MIRTVGYGDSSNTITVSSTGTEKSHVKSQLQQLQTIQVETTKALNSLRERLKLVRRDMACPTSDTDNKKAIEPTELSMALSDLCDYSQSVLEAVRTLENEIVL